jgi:hypothetical protein
VEDVHSPLQESPAGLHPSLMTRFPPVRTRLLFLQIFLGAFLCALTAAALWRLAAFPPDLLGAACLVAAVGGLLLLPAVIHRILMLFAAEYTIAASGSLSLRSGSWRAVIPVEEIEEIRSGGRIPDSIRKAAPGWIEMWHGRVETAEEGPIDWLATDRGRRLLLLVTKRRLLAVSPADSTGFAECLTDLSGRGSLEKIESVSLQPDSHLAKIFKNPPALALLAGGAVGMTGLGAFLTAIQPGLPADQPFRFDPSGTPVSLGDPLRLLILPMAGGLVWMVNAVIGWWAWKKGQKPSSFVLWTASVLVAIGLWAAAVSLLSTG